MATIRRRFGLRLAGGRPTKAWKGGVVRAAAEKPGTAGRHLSNSSAA